MSVNKYSISSIKQLIDLNGSRVNFHLTFQVKSVTNEPFDALVVTQEMLDSNSPLNYQRAEGEISGQIKNDNNVYNSYFLCVKSDKVMEIDVTVNITDVPPVVTPTAPTTADRVHPRTPRPNVPQRDNFEDGDDVIIPREGGNGVTVVSNTDFWIRLAIVFVCCTAIGFTVYYMYKKEPEPATSIVTSTEPVDSFIKDGLSEINDKISKLNEVTSKVSDGLHEVTHQVTQNLHSGFDKLHEEMKPVTDLGDIKESINNLKSLYTQNSAKIDITPPSTPLSIVTPTITLDTGTAVSNAEEVLSRLNSMKILGNNNKQ
jgi:hypothetical protein